MKIKGVQQIIDIIRGKYFGLAPMVLKSELIKSAKTYHTIAFGSSHMEHGFIPNEGEINIASPSQDLYNIYHLYQRYNTNEVKKIILTFSVFSPGDRLLFSGLSGMTILYKYLHDIPYEDDKLARKKHYNILAPFYINAAKKYKKKLVLPDNYWGGRLTRSNNINQDPEVLKIRALKHYKINQREKIPMNYFRSLLEDTGLNKQKVYVILPPALDAYKSPLPSSEIIFEELYKLCVDFPHVKILNLYDSEEFTALDFVDGDHVNLSGAEKMTQKIREFIR